MSNQINKKTAEIKEIGESIKETLKGEGEIDIQDALKKAAWVGGAAILTYWLLSKMFKKSKSDETSGKRRKKKKRNPILFGLIKQQAGLIILAVLRKHISKLLKEYKLIDEKESL